jgi:hypothetical protein
MAVDGHLKVISYGGGVQSTAMIILATQGQIPDVDAALFVNVGDDSEHPATLKFVREIMTPWASERGLIVHELRPRRYGRPTSILQEITRPGSRRDLIPVFGEHGGPMKRACTADFKIETIYQTLRASGATKENPAYVQLGISADEIQRAGRGVTVPIEIRQYPLLDMGLTRSDCVDIIVEAGLPVPRKSACFFCPFHSGQTWSEMRRDEPELFEEAQRLEDFLQARKQKLGLRKVYLTRKGAENQTRLSDTFNAASNPEPVSEVGSDGCDSGFCWT